MSPSSGRKVVKHCPQGHLMEMAWRSCPRCSGGEPAEEVHGRDMTEMTIILGAPPIARPQPLAPARPSWIVCFTAQTGPVTGQRLEATAGRYKLGRGPREEADFKVVGFNDSGMSRDHFALEVGVAAVIVRDLGSTNGTFVNGSRIERHVLAPGDSVRAGETVFRVELNLAGPTP
ncbi:MAG: FHA domain-containing protein [Candidatus Eisenbacteria bacterium]